MDAHTAVRMTREQSLPTLVEMRDTFEWLVTTAASTHDRHDRSSPVDAFRRLLATPRLDVNATLTDDYTSYWDRRVGGTILSECVRLIADHIGVYDVPDRFAGERNDAVLDCVRALLEHASTDVNCYDGRPNGQDNLRVAHNVCRLRTLDAPLMTPILHMLLSCADLDVSERCCSDDWSRTLLTFAVRGAAVGYLDIVERIVNHPMYNGEVACELTALDHVIEHGLADALDVILASPRAHLNMNGFFTPLQHAVHVMAYAYEESGASFLRILRTLLAHDRCTLTSPLVIKCDDRSTSDDAVKTLTRCERFDVHNIVFAVRGEERGFYSGVLHY